MDDNKVYKYTSVNSVEEFIALGFEPDNLNVVDKFINRTTFEPTFIVEGSEGELYDIPVYIVMDARNGS